MAEKFQENAIILRQDNLAEGIYSIWFETKDIAKYAKAGQFVAVYSNDDSHLLPRPISICEVDKEKNAIRIVYRVAGAGTLEFSGYKAGDTLRIMGPLGNGYPEIEGDVMVVGGGIGVPPMLELAKQLRRQNPNRKVTAVLGYRNDLFLKEEFEAEVPVVIATEDGSTGTKGTVIDAIKAQNVTADVICTCGPTPMLRALKEYAAENGMKLYVSLEERMGCGIGACLACVCKTKEKDEHSNVNNTRICKEGPVFLAEEVEF